MTEFERLKLNIKIMKLAAKFNAKKKGSLFSTLSDYREMKKEIETT